MNVKQRNGWVLLEVIIAVAVLASTLLLVAQWLQVKQQHQQRILWVADSERLQASIKRYWLLFDGPPTSIAELAQDLGDDWASPWQQEWLFDRQPELLKLTLTAPSVADALWLAGQLPNAQSQQQQVALMVWPPSVNEHDASAYLHRVKMPAQPHLNSMEHDLDMGGFDLKGVNQLTALSIDSDSIVAEQAQLDTITATQADFNTVVANDFSADGVSLLEVYLELIKYQELWRECIRQQGCL